MRKTWVVCLLAMVCCALWGSAFPCIKVGYRLFQIDSADTATQILFAGCRFTIAGIMVILFGSILQGRFLKPGKGDLPRIGKICLLQTVIQYFFFYVGLAHTTGVKGSIVEASNVFLAKKYGITPVGTMAHEWIMCVGQGNHKHNPAYSNWYALDWWVKEYGILNGTALTDAITTDCFLRDFQLTYATLFSGVRHDSGNPFEWGEKMIRHYESLGIDPKTKTLLFSDSLDFERADKIASYFAGKVKIAFGIGTYISNDTDVPALNIVMKTTKCNGMDVAKISDTPGKGMCKNPEYVEYLQRCISWRMENDR